MRIVGFIILGLIFVLAHSLSGSEEDVIFAQNELKTVKQEFSPKIGELNWIDEDDNNTLSVSTETSEPIYGNGSLRVDIKPTTSINAAKIASWSVVTTDFIPAVEKTLYNYTLDVSAEHVNQLHPKVYYYNLSKMTLSENFIFGGKDGTFKERFNNSFLSPMGTKFLQFQMWVKPTTGSNASYLIDNINLGQNETYSLDTSQNITERQPTELTQPLPVITNNNSYFSIERIFTGLNFPTSMAFLGPDDILVLEKNQGMVKRIVNGTMFGDPLLDVNVGTKAERGMLGIDISRQNNEGTTEPTIYVFLYYTETKQRDGEDNVTSRYADIPGQGPLGNRLYRYELVDNKLVNPKLLIDLPAEPKLNHQGGVVQVGPDNNVYMIIGDVDHFTQAQNYKDGNTSDGTGGILMISQEGKAIENGILGNSYPLNLYYAYGIRNSFGFDFDPVTGNLWDTENGLRCCDEINLVEKGFNSGWDKVQGFWKTNHSQNRDREGKFDEIIFPEILKNSVGNIFDISINQDMIDNRTILGNTSLGTGTDYIAQTIPYPVKQDHIYDYAIGIKGNNISSNSIIASFGNSNDVSENVTRYGNNASNGGILTLDKNSEIHMKLNVIKAGNYTIALKARTCNTCTYLTASMASSDNANKLLKDSQIGNYSLKSNESALKWVYANSSFNLFHRNYDLKIYSDSITDLDIVAVYLSKSTSSIEKTDELLRNNQIENIFAIENNRTSPAKISEYQKINPTKYVLKIDNASRPYVISFAESYDPLWQARIDRVESNDINNLSDNNYKTNSMPLYGLTNGFYVNKTGDYDLVIEYSPQLWFGQGLIVSILSLAAMVVLILLSKKSRKRIMEYVSGRDKRHNDPRA